MVLTYLKSVLLNGLGTLRRRPCIPRFRTCFPAGEDGSSDARVAVLVFDHVKLLDVAGPVEVFAEANRHGADYDVRVVSVDGAERDLLRRRGLAASTAMFALR